MKTLLPILDATLGRAVRHLFFVLVRIYFALFYNVSCTNKHLLQDLPGGLVLATHVSRLDGPLIASQLYPVRRLRAAVHYDEFYNPLQYLPMKLSDSIPVSSPKSWPAEKRAARKVWALDALTGVIKADNFVLLFPGGQAKRQPREIIQPHFSGAYDVLRAVPESPVVLARIHGLSKFDHSIRDLFWSFLGIKNGRRHISVSLEVIEGGLDTSAGLEAFNRDLEERLNAGPDWPAADPLPEAIGKTAALRHAALDDGHSGRPQAIARP